MERLINIFLLIFVLIFFLKGLAVEQITIINDPEDLRITVEDGYTKLFLKK